MKKLLAIILMVALVVLACPAVFAEENTEIRKSYQLATDFLSEYYLSVDQYEAYNMSDFVNSNDLLQYINNKIEAKRYKAIAYGIDDIQNYRLSFTLDDFIYSNDLLKLSVLVQADFKYKNADFDSSFVETNWVIISNSPENKIVNWYNPSDFYDVKLRGEITDIDVLNNFGNYAKRTNDSYIPQYEINNNLKSYYETIKSQSDLTETSVNGSKNSYTVSALPRATLYSLNRGNMVNWANNNCKVSGMVSGNPNLVSKYYDFSLVSSSAYDCTNFVSHAILAGGAVTYDIGNAGVSETGWYFRDINNRSHSWSGVVALYNFLTTNKVKGPVGTYVAYTPIYSSSSNLPYNAGDLMQFYASGETDNWRHSGLITGFINTDVSGSTLEPTITCRSENVASTCRKNVRQSDIYPGEPRRVIKLLGYYK